MGERRGVRRGNYADKGNNMGRTKQQFPLVFRVCPHDMRAARRSVCGGGGESRG